MILLFSFPFILSNFNVNFQNTQESGINSPAIVNNLGVDVTHPSDFGLPYGDPTNHTISWTLTADNSTDYLGLYSFTTDPDGVIPAGWTCTIPSGDNIQIVAGMTGHHKVVHFNSTTTSREDLTNSFSPQTSGTIAFWIFTNGSSVYGPGIYIEPQGINSYPMVFGLFMGAYFEWCSMGSWSNITPVTPAVLKKWYHIQMTFNDAARTVQLYINGIKYSNMPYCYPGLESTPNGLSFIAYGENLSCYMDAIDYSWAPGYYLNRNMDFEPSPKDYYGLFSFTTDSDGGIPTGWTRPYHNANTDGKIIAEKAGHRKVIETYDNNPSGYTIFEQNFANKTIGTVEWWYYGVNGTGKSCNFQLCLHNYLGFSGVYLILNISYAELGYWDTRYNKICNLLNNQWHHFRVIFNCGFDTFNLWLDGIERITNAIFQYPQANLTKTTLYTGGVSTGGYYAYFDAFDYSWAPGYYSNRNMNYSSYNLTYAIFERGVQKTAWQTWSTQVTVNYNVSGTGLGAGMHNVSLVFNDNSGNWLHDDVIVTVIDPENPNILGVIQNPITPTYPQPVNVTAHITDNIQVQTAYIETNYTGTGGAGDYEGTYSFENDADGTVPAGWTRPYHGPNTDGYILAEKAGHHKIIALYDNNPDTNGQGYTTLRTTFPAQKTGTMEFWFYGTAVGPYSGHQFCLGGALGFIYLWMDTTHENLSYYDGSWHLLCNLPNEVWHHFRVQFNCTIDKFDIWVDSNQKATGCGFDGSATNITTLDLYTGGASTGGFYVYFDAFDFSWDSGYYLNRNMQAPGFVNYSMTLIGGTQSDGIWTYTFNNYPLNKSIFYRILVKDTFGNWNATGYYNFECFDYMSPSIESLVQTPVTLTKWESVKVITHIHEDTELANVTFNSNYSGTWVTYPMMMVNGTLQDGFWEYIILKTQYIYNRTISYRISATDVAGRTTTTGYYNFGIFPIISYYVPLTITIKVDIGKGASRKGDITFKFLNTGNTNWANLSFVINIPTGWTTKPSVCFVSQLAPGQNVTITFKLTLPKNVSEIVELVFIDVSAVISETGLEWTIPQPIQVFISKSKVGDFFIWVIVVVGSASAAVATSYVYIHKRSLRQQAPKIKIKGKGALAISNTLLSNIPGSLSVISIEEMEKINSLPNITSDEKTLLIQYINQLDEETALKFLDEIKKNEMD